MTAPPIHLYAELLLHINTVSLHASFETVTAAEASEASEATIGTDGPFLRVTHQGSVATLRLPVQTVGCATSTVQLPAGRPKELAARLQVKAAELSHLMGLQQDGQDSLPWGAKHFTSSTRVFCRGCGEDLFDANHAIGDWRDLPSENWAEMMDFWHCHKPVSHRAPSDGNDASAQKGYAASSQLKAMPGVGLVDVSTFLLAEQDTKAFKTETSENEILLYCASPKCKQLLGHIDARAAGNRIYKWSVAVQPSSHSMRQTFSEEKWITAQMLSVLEAQSIRKFVVRKLPGSGEPVERWLLWLFTPDLRFCSSTSPPAVSLESQPTLNPPNQQQDEAGQPVRACKMLYRKLPPHLIGPDAKDEPTTVQQENLDLPAPLAAALFAAIEDSARLLPPKARTQGPWKVGLLRRFAPEDAVNQASAASAGDASA